MPAPSPRRRNSSPLKTAVVVPRPSDGALALARQLGNGTRLVKRDRIEQVASAYKFVVNWGCSSLPALELPVINKPEAVALCVNKRTFFEEVGDLTNMHVRYSRSDAEALFRTHRKVICRTVVNGSSGEGIVVARSVNELVPATLYTAYIPKSAEYRVHVLGNKAVLVQQKRRALDNEVVDPDAALIRNHDNGWIFAVDNVDPPTDDMISMCVRIVSELGLDFGAVDVMIGASNGKPYILEVNTAPGLSGPTTLSTYSTALAALIAAKAGSNGTES